VANESLATITPTLSGVEPENFSSPSAQKDPNAANECAALLQSLPLKTHLGQKNRIVEGLENE
jgi:hypothetical protein